MGEGWGRAAFHRMSTVLSNTPSRVARKRYRCWYCAQSIEKGEKHTHRTGVDGGDFWTMRAHPECDDYAAEHWGYDDYEFHEPGDFTRPMTAFDPVI